MSNLDMNKTGKILVSDVRRMLKGYGIRMTDDQWNSIMNVIGTEGKDMLDLKTFIEYVMHGQVSQNWLLLFILSLLYAIKTKTILCVCVYVMVFSFDSI